MIRGDKMKLKKITIIDTRAARSLGIPDYIFPVKIEFDNSYVLDAFMKGLSITDAIDNGIQVETKNASTVDAVVQGIVRSEKYRSRIQVI